MKKRIHCILLMMVVASAICCTSCDDNTDRNIYTQVTMVAELPDGRSIVRMEADETLDGTYLRNINNRMEYEFPLFINNCGNVKLQKGVYLIAFDADATFADGTTARVRCSEYSAAETAAELLDDNETIVLRLTQIN